MNQSKLAVNSRSERKAGKGRGGGGWERARLAKGGKMSASKLWLVLGITSDWMKKYRECLEPIM